MKAAEAREIAKAANTADMTEIYKAIKTFADKGDLFTHIYTPLTTLQYAELRANGYKVEDVSSRNETCISISWKD